MRTYRQLSNAARLTALISLLPAAAWAASPGVPALPVTPYNYVNYAVTGLPDHFARGPVDQQDNTPADNAITNAGAALGRVLFYDERLSHSDGLSCSSCHTQQTGFSDPNRFSTGFEGGKTPRHSMGLSNAAYYQNGRFFWDQRASTLEQQVLMPIQDAVEMGSNLTDLTAELAATDFYPKLFNAAFGTPEVTSDRMSKALAQFVRSMKSYNSKYDDAVEAGTQANPNFANFTAQELLGNNIFHGVGGCAACHATHAQVGDAPHNTGLDATVTDAGVGQGRFKVPSLRNAEVRSGFMHDGRFTTLEQVVEFYNSGVQNNPFLDPRLRVNGQGPPRRLNLTQAQKDALVAFLKTLTDTTFLNSSLFSNPFVELAGDFNGDGVVDADDLATWQTSLAAGGDATGEGFLDWQRNLGMTWENLAITSTASASAVPEPSAALLLGTTTCVLIALERRKRRRQTFPPSSHESPRLRRGTPTAPVPQLD